VPFGTVFLVIHFTVVSEMHTRRGERPGSDPPGNVDRRKGFLDVVERLSQGVVAVARDEKVTSHAGDRVNAEPTQPTSPPRPDGWRDKKSR
jgi:hypothetical protein